MSLSSSPAPVADNARAIDIARIGLFVAALGLAWITVDPFADLRSNAMVELASGRDGVTYASYFVLAAGGLALVYFTQREALKALVTPWSILLAAWLVLAVVTSHDVGTSARRFVLFLMVAVVAASAFLMPSGRRALALALAGMAGFLLFLSYGGALAIPEYAIHQASDIVEAQLAGDWRGVFSHKNAAGAIFAMCVFFGIFAVRAGFVVAGVAVIVFSALFVVLSGSKSSAVLLVATLMASGFVAWARSTTLRALAIFSPLAALLALGPGSILSETLASITRLVPIDMTFTGRTEVWDLAFDKIAERPLLGYGFTAFWTLESTRYGTDDVTWAAEAAHAHNSYIDTALNLGLPGLALTFAVFMIQPFRDFCASRRAGADPALTIMLLQVWMFGIYLSVMESFLYVRVDPIWFTFLFAVFGLRYVAVFTRTRA